MPRAHPLERHDPEPRRRCLMTIRHIEALAAIAFGLVVVLTLTGGG